ncbi:Uncharacterised protein [uncultured archaeon]|nr:Uncharacterised protein [uncultured archaeon]
MTDSDLQRSIEAMKSILQPLRQDEFSERLYKVSFYVYSVAKSWNACRSYLSDLKRKDAADPGKISQAMQARVESFQASVKNALGFARINLDAAMVLALERLVWRPKSAGRQDEQRKAGALQKVFDGMPEPGKAMLQHYRDTSDPLDKWLVAGPWGHEYLKKRHIDSEALNLELCEMLACGGSAAGKVALSYSRLYRAIGDVEEAALKMQEV